MDNIKNDKYYANKILNDVRYLIKLSKEYSREQISNNETVLDSILFRFVQIAENSLKLTPGFKQKHNKIMWTSINGLRNRIVHDYGHTDFSIILDTLEKDIPEFEKVLEDSIW